MTACGIDNLEQTMFLGCSVLDFSCSLGLNEQPTEVTVRLVRDTCAATKIYYDITQVGNIRKEWTGPDPGLNSFGINADSPPTLGAPVYFRVADFEFMGILQSWTKTNTKSDQDVYEVKLTSPTEILAGCQLIIGNYSGPIKGFNIFNIYGFQESFGSSLAAPSYTDPNAPVDGPIMGTFIGAFGGAGVNDAGMTWNKIKESIHILTSNVVPAHLLGYGGFTQNGRICYFGASTNANFGLIPRDDINLNIGLAFGLSTDLAYYYIDISEIPNVPDDYRIQGPSIDLLSLISQICNDFGFDFYIDFLPVNDGAELRKFIKVRTISRLNQPDLDIVQQFIDATPEVIDSSFGRELRNENATTFLLGGNKQSIWQIEAGLPDPLDDPEEDWLFQRDGNEPYTRQRIAPFFGINSSGNAYTLYTDANPLDSYINLDISSKHTWKILGPLLPFQIPVTIGEMRAAEHSYDTWTWYSKFSNTYLRTTLVDQGYDVDTTFLATLLNLNSRIQPRDLAALHAKELLDQLSAELRIYRQIIADIYTQSKSTLMVRVPWVVSKYEIDSTTVANTLADLHIQRTDDPSDGGWTEAGSVLYLNNPSVYVDRFRLEDGRIKPFALFDLVSGVNGPSVGSASSNQFDTESSFAIDRQVVAGLSTPGNLLYYSFEQEQELVYLNRAQLMSPRVVIRFSNPLDFANDSNPFFAKNGWNLMQNAQAFAKLQSMGGGVENELLINIAGEGIYYPTAVAIALKSNSFIYGPWKPSNIIESGPPGQIRFDQDDTLVPWAFGSYANLDILAQQRANSSVTAMTVGEVGTVTVPGWPDVPLGAEIAALRGLTNQFYDQDQHLIENRTPIFSNFVLNDLNGGSAAFSVPSFNYGYWNGSFGPTITSINIEVGESTLSTTYTFRTYTPKFGVMTKLNADRLQRKFIQQNHGEVPTRFLNELKFIQNQYRTGLRRLAQVGDLRATKGTPHSVLVGQSVKWDSNIITGIDNSGDGSFRRNIIATKDLFELQSSLYASNPTSSGVSYTDNVDYEKMAIMSWDGLVRPVSMDGVGGLPRYINNTISSQGNTAPAIAPFSNTTGGAEYNYNISLNFLNPFSNPHGFNRSQLAEKHTGVAGHDIDIIGRGTLPDFSGEGSSLIMPTDSGGFFSSTRADYNNDYRPLALRGPILLQGWGYDTDGKPVPNASDIENSIANSGIFASSGLSNKFLSDFLRKPQTWPVAPLDLRLDRKRNVWTSSPPYDFVIATLQQNIIPLGSGLARITPINAYDSDGIAITQGNIVVKDQVGFEYQSGSKIIAYYDTKNSVYNIIETKSTGGSSAILHFQLINDKSKADLTVSGIQIGCTGAALTTPFLLYDREQRYYGLSGYKGYASPILCTGGVNQYEIINMEGPALFAVATTIGPIAVNSFGQAELVESFGPWPNSLPAITTTGEDGERTTRIRVYTDSWQGGALPHGTKIFAALYDDVDINDIGYKVIVPISGGGSSNSTIHFSLRQNKPSYLSPVLVNTLNCSGNISATGVNVYDPQERYFGLSGFKGYATLCSDGSRYEITNMEGPAQFVIATLDSSLSESSSVSGTIISYFGPDNARDTPFGASGVKVRVTSDSWQQKTLDSGTKVLTILEYLGSAVEDAYYKLVVPLEDSSVVYGNATTVVLNTASSFTIDTLSAVEGSVPSSPLTVNQIFPVGYALGERVLAIKRANGTWINTPDNGRVLGDSACTFPESLYDKLINHETFSSGSHQRVYAQSTDVGLGVKRINLFTALGGGSSVYTVIITGNIGASSYSAGILTAATGRGYLYSEASPTTYNSIGNIIIKNTFSTSISNAAGRGTIGKAYYYEAGGMYDLISIDCTGISLD